MAEAASPARRLYARSGHPHAIRAVLFDFDGVITTDAYGSLTTVRSLAAAAGLSEAAVAAALAPFMPGLILGRESHASIWSGFVARLGTPIEASWLHAAFDATPINAPMLDLARRLATRCRVGIVTDNTADRMARLTGRHALDALFDPIVVSASVGHRKTEPAIFEAALCALRVAPCDTVFIDNTPANLAVPAALGMHALHFDDAANDVAGLEATLRERFGLDVSNAGSVAQA